MDEPSTDWDSIVYAYSTVLTSPDSWAGRATPNDHRATGEYGARVGYASGLSGGYVTYRRWADSQVYFDGWSHTGAEEDRAPAMPGSAFTATLLAGCSSLRLHLEYRSDVKIVMYDGAGRVVEPVFNGTLEPGPHRLSLPTDQLAQGVYFLSLALDGRTTAAKFIRLH